MSETMIELSSFVPVWVLVALTFWLSMVAASSFSRTGAVFYHSMSLAVAVVLYFLVFHELSDSTVSELREKGLLTDCVIEKTISMPMPLALSGRLTYQKIGEAIQICNIPSGKKKLSEKLKPKKTTKEVEQ